MICQCKQGDDMCDHCTSVMDEARRGERERIIARLTAQKKTLIFGPDIELLDRVIAHIGEDTE